MRKRWVSEPSICHACLSGFMPATWLHRMCESCRTTCRVEDCDRPGKTNGLCGAHYWRHMKKGEIGSAAISMRRDGRTIRARKAPRIELQCHGCNMAFTCPPSLAKAKDGTIIRKYCTKACMLVSVDKKPQFTCEQCREVKTRAKYLSTGGYDYSQRFCSRVCRSAARARTGYIDKNGYRMFSIDGRDIPEHRIVMSKILGRELFAEETVHHRDGDRQNNAPDNLELWSSRHGKGQRVEDKIEFCQSFLADYGLLIPRMDPSMLLAGAMGCA